MTQLEKKILTEDNLDDLVQNRKSPLIWTNGCFDLIHTGHINYLLACKNLGGDLIIGVNTDESVKKLKGDRRPILPLEDRIHHLAAFFFVDYIFPFSEETPLKWIQKLKPDFLVKGGDYKINEIVGYTEVLAYGGQVKTIPLVPGKSTTSIIDKILDSYDKS